VRGGSQPTQLSKSTSAKAMRLRILYLMDVCPSVDSAPNMKNQMMKTQMKENKTYMRTLKTRLQ